MGLLWGRRADVGTMIKPPGFIRRLPVDAAAVPETSVYRAHPFPHLIAQPDMVVYGICQIPPGCYLDVPFACSPGVLWIFSEVLGATMAVLVKQEHLAMRLAGGGGPHWGCYNGRACDIDLRKENLDDPLHLIVINEHDHRDVVAYYRLGTEHAH